MSGLELEQSGQERERRGQRSSAGPAGCDPTGCGLWLRAVRSELVKAATLPSLRWTLLVTCAAGGALVLSAFQNNEDGSSFGFDQIAPMWTQAVQIGFLAAGILAPGSEYSGGQGAITLLVTPARGHVALARLAVLAGTGLASATVLVATGVLACPEVPTAAPEAGVRTVAWLTAVLLLAAGIGEMLRHTTAAATTAVLLVVIAPQLAALLGDTARWLPGAAGQTWVTGAAPRADVVTAGLTILVWTTAAQAGGILRLTRACWSGTDHPDD